MLPHSPTHGLLRFARNDGGASGALLPRHLRSPYPITVQLLIVVHLDRHFQQLPGEFERRLVVRNRTGTVAADVEAGPRDEIVEGRLGLNAILNDPGPLSIHDREMEERLSRCLLLLLQAEMTAALANGPARHARKRRK